MEHEEKEEEEELWGEGGLGGFAVGPERTRLCHAESTILALVFRARRLMLGRVPSGSSPLV